MCFDDTVHLSQCILSYNTVYTQGDAGQHLDTSGKYKIVLSAKQWMTELVYKEC